MLSPKYSASIAPNLAKCQAATQHLKKKKTKIFNFLNKNKLQSKSTCELDSIETLYNYLSLRLKENVNYEDLYNLYYSLFCTLEILPENLKSLKLSKEVLSLTFAKLSVKKNVTNFSNNKIFETEFNDISDENHWIEQIDICMRDDKWPNIKNARKLLEMNQ